MPTILDSLTPADLSFPSRFSTYRRAQSEITDFVLYGPGGGLVPNSESNSALGPRRFMCVGAPAGIGKSLTAHTIGKLSGMRYAVLTATRALEDQQAEDFVDGADVVNIRGKANYTCVDWQPGLAECNCDEGSGERECPRAGKPGCTYFDQAQAARRARGIVTNYAYWIASRMANPRALETPGQKIGMLICDEAHLCMGMLANALSTWVSNEDLHRWAGKETRALVKSAKGEEWGRVNSEWVTALEYVSLGARVKMTELETEFGGSAKAATGPDYQRLVKLLAGVDRVVSHGRDNNWIWRLTRNGISFDCIWPGKYADRYLWSGVEKVVLMSATLVPKAMHLLRIPSTEYCFKEWPRQFAAKNCPVWWVPNGRMGQKSGEVGLAKCVSFGDQLFNEWRGRKGIVHTPSYKLARALQSHCKWGRYMFLNENGGDAAETARRFRLAKPPAVLVSPSFTTGHDFPDEQAEWEWIPKLPFPDRSDPIALARKEDDPDYDNYQTMQTLVQACYRGQRHENDKCTVVITDDAVGNFRNYAKRFAPRWYRVDKWEGDGIPPCTY